MPYLHCYCDNRISLSEIPLPNGLFVCSEEALFEALDATAQLLAQSEADVAERRRRLWQDIFGHGNARTQRAVQCDSCGRLLVLSDADDVVRSFLPEKIEVNPRSQNGRGAHGFFAE